LIGKEKPPYANVKAVIFDFPIVNGDGPVYSSETALWPSSDATHPRNSANPPLPR
jgi:hypothetical protein